MIELLLRMLLLLFSFYGYFLWIEKKGIDIAFAPVLTVSSIGVVMFFAGILNIMPLTARTLFLGGIVLLVLHCAKKPLPFPLPRTAGILLLFGIFYFLLAWRIRGEMILEYDNFSHWLLVMKDILRNDALPNYASSMIEFQSYPTGTAGFLYYICLALGATEGVILFGQSVLLLSGVLVFWAFLPRLISIPSLIALLCSAYLFVANIPLSNLSVDSLLSVLAIASFAIAVYYQSNTSYAAICCGILGSYLILVKNSGIFFLVIHALLLLFLDLRQQKSLADATAVRKLFKNLIFSLLIPLFVCYLWNRHVAYAFPEGNISKHSMTLANYANIWGEKSAEDAKAILLTMLTRICTPEKEGFLLTILLGLYLSGFGIRRCFHAEKTKDEFRYAGWSILTYITYLAGIAAMYLFSMPYKEAISLGSFDRYIATITMYLTGIACIYLLGQLKGKPKSFSFRILAIAVMVLLLSSVPYRLMNLFTFPQDNTDSVRGTLQRIQADYDIDNGARYYIAAEYDHGYIYWMARYEFWSQDVIMGYEPDANSHDFYNDFDYVILMMENSATDKLLEDLNLPAGQKAYRLTDYQ